MNRSRSSIFAIKTISSSFNQVSFFLNSSNFLLNSINASLLGHHRRRRDLCVAAQEAVFWPKSDPGGACLQNPSGSDKGSSLTLRQNSEWSWAEAAPSSQQNLNGFNGGLTFSHQRFDLVEFRQPNTYVEYQRSNLGNGNSNNFHGKHPNFGTSECFNLMNNGQNTTESSMTPSGGDCEDDDYPYENLKAFFREEPFSRNSDMSLEDLIDAFRKKPRIISVGSRVDIENSYERQSGFFQEYRNPAFRQNQQMLSVGSGVGDGSGHPGQSYQIPYGFHVENPFPYESPLIYSPTVNNGAYTEESLVIREVISYVAALNKLDELCKEQKVKEAIAVLAVFEKIGMVIDQRRYLRLVQACGEVMSLEKGRLVHDHLSRRLGKVDVSVHNKILDMYCKCGSMVDAYDLFEKMPCKNLMSWETMIRGLSDNNLGEEAIDLFTQLKETGLKPDEDLFAAIFYACGVVGAIDQGLLYYKSMMVDFGIVPIMEHYVSIVDMFGRNGYLDEALEFIEAMPIEPNVDVWETLMNFCIVNGYIELGDRCAEIVEQLDSSRITEQSKICLLPSKSLEIAKEKEIEESSDFDVKGYTHKFMAGRPEDYMIYEQIRCLAQQMKEAGYVPIAALTLHDIDLEAREEALLYHSERLAIVQGLMTSPARRPLTILKNLRVCSDCHNALKIISNLTGRLIKARDAKRFHHFEKGACSCNDYW